MYTRGLDPDFQSSLLDIVYTRRLDPDFRPYLPGTGHSVHQKVGSRLPVLSSRYEAGPRLRSSLLTTRTLTFCEKLCVDRHLAESDSVVTGKVVNAESSSVVV